jgi:3',5'-cyclic AMP phosphodiesterase CpdA
MSTYNRQGRQSSELPRQAFLRKSAAAAGAGLLWSLGGGKLAARVLAAGQQDHTATQSSGFSFVQISDTHIGFHSAPNHDVVGTFERVIQRINALPQRPAFVVHTGDHVHLSKPQEFDTVKQLLSTIKTDRIFNLPGEHDVFLDQGKRYRQLFAQGTQGTGYWSFDLQGVHFIGLVNDAGLVGKGQGTLGAEQLNFIKKDLVGVSSDTPLVLFSHVPLLPVYVPWGWSTSDAAALLALVQRFSTVTALNGHIHQRITKRAGNIVMHTANSTAYPDAVPGQGPGPLPLVVPAAVLPTRIGLRTVGVPAGDPAMLAVKDQTLA